MGGRTTFVFRDDRTLCLPCYTDKFAEKCEKCSKSIQPGEQYLQVEGKRFHEECLTCDICADQLQDHPFVQDGTRNVCVNCSTNGMTSYKEKGAAAATTAAAGTADSPAKTSDGMDLKDWIGDKSKPNETNRNSADGGEAGADGGGCCCTNAEDEESAASSGQGCCDNGESNFSAASDADPSSSPLQSVDDADVGSSNFVPQSGNVEVDESDTSDSNDSRFDNLDGNVSPIDQSQRQSANVASNSQRPSANMAANLQRQSANITADSQRQSANTASNSQRQSANMASNSQRQSANEDRNVSAAAGSQRPSGAATSSQRQSGATAGPNRHNEDNNKQNQRPSTSSSSSSSSSSSKGNRQ